MKLFIFSAFHAGRHFEKYESVIFDYIKKEKYRYLGKSTRSRSFSLLKHIDEQGIAAYRKRHIELLNNLKQADACIFEISYPNWATGFFISKALDQGKPVIAFYLKNHDSFSSTGIQEEKLFLVEYTSIPDLKKKLPAVFLQMKKSIDRRFNFYIPAELITFIQKESKRLGKTKSTFLRDIIRDYMKKNI